MEWINVNNELPKDGSFLVLYWSQTIADIFPNKKMQPGICIWRSKEKMFDWYEKPRHFKMDFNELIPVTHWMPLPEPPNVTP